MCYALLRRQVACLLIAPDVDVNDNDIDNANANANININARSKLEVPYVCFDLIDWWKISAFINIANNNYSNKCNKCNCNNCNNNSNFYSPFRLSVFKIATTFYLAMGVVKKCQKRSGKREVKKWGSKGDSQKEGEKGEWAGNCIEWADNNRKWRETTENKWKAYFKLQ